MLLEWDVAQQQGAELVVRSVVKVSQAPEYKTRRTLRAVLYSPTRGGSGLDPGPCDGRLP